MARRRFFVAAIHGGFAELTGDDARHLVRVLRAEAGERYEISDNRAPFLAEVAEVSRDRVVFRVLEPVQPRLPPCEVALCVALVRFERFEWMVEKATELGAAALVPFEAARSEKGLAAAGRKRVERWRRIAREAGEQSRRDRLPEVRPPGGWEECLAEPAALRWFLDEETGVPPLAASVPRARSAADRVALLVGPEGGWTDRERARAAEAGWQAVSLAPFILRTETAAIAALSVIVNTWMTPADR